MIETVDVNRIPGSDWSRQAWKLALFVVFMASTVVLIASWHAYREVEVDTRQKLATKARLVEVQVAHLVRGINTILNQVLTETERTGRCDQRLIQNLGRINPEFRAISVIDQQGTIQCASLPELIGLKLAAEDRVKQAMAAPEPRRLIIEKPFKAQPTGAAVLLLHKSIVNPAGKLQFMAQISIDLPYFDRLLEALREDRQTLVLSHDSGTVVSRFPDPNKYRFADLSKGSLINRHVDSSEKISTHRQVVATDGIERFAAITEVSTSSFAMAPRGKLFIGVGESVADAYASWYRRTWLSAFGWLLLVGTAVAMTVWAEKKHRWLRAKVGRQDRSITELLDVNQMFLKEQEVLDEHAIVSEANTRGEIISANKKFCEISGYPLQELLGKNHSILNSHTHPPAFFQHMWRTITAGQPWQGLLCNRAKDGHLYWVKSTIAPVRNSQGYIEKYVSFRTDVTPLMETQELLRRAQKDLLAAKEEAERQRVVAESANRQKSQFLANMSHELRTPMNAILGFSQILQMENLEAEVHDSVDQINKAGHHLLRLINEVLDLSRIETGNLELKMEVVAVGALLSEALGTIEMLAQRHGIALHLSPLQAPLFLKADAHRLQQVMLNLISNAIKYNRPQGSVSVTTRLEDGRVRISVADTGIGLSAQNLEKIFTPYTRFGPNHIEGTGIGLTITKRLVEAMGGTLGVDSVEHVGSTFWVEFQSTGSHAFSLTAIMGKALNASEDEATASRLRGTLLYIEDNIPNQVMVQRLLKDFTGLQLLMAADPLLGLKLAVEHTPDLILLDINLPGIDGFEVLSRLRSAPQTRHIPVVGVSANAMPDDKAKAEAAGFSDYLTKPADIFSLLRIVRLYLHPKAA